MSSMPLPAPLLGISQPVRAQWGAPAAGAGGSYTPVWIVLGVIAALLVISCLVGQVCTKKHLRPRPRRDRVGYYDEDMEGGRVGWAVAAKLDAAPPQARAVAVAVDGTAS